MSCGIRQHLYPAPLAIVSVVVCVYDAMRLQCPLFSLSA